MVDSKVEKVTELIVGEEIEEIEGVIDEVQIGGGVPLDMNPVLFREGLDRRKENRNALLAWVREALVEDLDFGRIHVMPKDKCPDPYNCKNDYHFSRPSLWKSGAEKILGMLNITVKIPSLREYEEMALNGGKIQTIMLRSELWLNGHIIAEGIGARDVSEDRGNLNKALKMAKKSCIIDGTLQAGGLSEVFTQDLEDMNLGDEEPTQGQVDLMANLLRSHLFTEEEKNSLTVESEGLSKKDASGWIDKVKGILEDRRKNEKKDPPQESPPPVESESPPPSDSESPPEVGLVSNKSRILFRNLIDRAEKKGLITHLTKELAQEWIKGKDLLEIDVRGKIDSWDARLKRFFRVEKVISQLQEAVGEEWVSEEEELELRKFLIGWVMEHSRDIETPQKIKDRLESMREIIKQRRDVGVVGDSPSEEIVPEDSPDVDPPDVDGKEKDCDPKALRDLIENYTVDIKSSDPLGVEGVSLLSDVYGLAGGLRTYCLIKIKGEWAKKHMEVASKKNLDPNDCPCDVWPVLSEWVLEKISSFEKKFKDEEI